MAMNSSVANLTPTNTDNKFEMISLATEGPVTSDESHKSESALSPHQPTPTPRPSIVRSHKSAPSALQSRVPQIPFVVDHQGLGNHEPFSSPSIHDLELSAITESSQTPEVQSSDKESTDKVTTSPPGFCKWALNYLWWSLEESENPVRSVHVQLEIKLQEAFMKIQDLTAQERAAKEELCYLVCAGQPGQTSTAFTRCLLRMRIRKAHEDITDIRKRLYEESEIAKAVMERNAQAMVELERAGQRTG